jgi:hypothetical protein
VQHAVTALKDACTALSAVSAVLWTGGLIILQLRSSRGGLNLGDTAEVTDYDRQTTAIKGALACIAFSMLAPVFILFVSGVGIRIGGFLFFLLYLWMTWWHIPQVVKFFRSAFREAANSALFLLPTLAMLLVGLFPSALTVVWSSGVLLFLGFFVLSQALYALSD